MGGLRARALLLTVITAFAAGLAMPGSGYCQEKLTLTLDECIKRAVMLNPEIKEAEFEAEVYRGKKRQADSARYPQVELVAYGSLSPRARLKPGSQVESETNINKPSYDGVFGRADVQLIQPIYTFGKISAYREAAAHGVKAFEAGAKLKSTEVALLVKEAYYGLLLGRELKAFLLDIKGQLDKATDKVSSQLDAGAPNVDQVDLLKLQTYQGELQKYMALVDEGVNKAYFGLKLLTGVGIEDERELEITDEFLTPAEVKVEDFSFYRDMAMRERLEFVQLNEGLIAREALIKAQYADYYPQVFIAVVYSLAGATNRDRINNPYITDELNHNYGGAVLGFKWSFDFGIHRGRVDEARAEYMKLKMKQYYAEGGVPFQVKEAYLKYVESTEEIKALRGAYGNAKQWVVASVSNFDLGVGEARDIADSVGAYARIRADYFRAIFNQRMALAELDHATGKDALDVPYTVSQNPMDGLAKMEEMVNGNKEGSK